jgi:acyl carrier protein
MTTGNAADTGQRVRGSLAKILNVDTSELSPVALIEDLGADSLDIAELSALLAEQGIELDKAAARQAASVADLIAIARPR